MLTSSCFPDLLNEMKNVPLSAQGFVLEWSSGSRTRFRSNSSSSVRFNKNSDAAGGVCSRLGVQMLRVEKATGCGECYTEAHSFQVSRTKIIFLRCLVRWLLFLPRPSQRAVRRGPLDEKPGGVADRGFWGAIFSPFNHWEAGCGEGGGGVGV